jgi:hypothetical protein
MEDRQIKQIVERDPLLQLRGSGKKLWAEEHADEYVRRLREDWADEESDAETANT